MDEHNAHVRQVTPPHKFHMMELKQGWEPLCRMLNVEAPETPFPRVNDTQAVDAVASQILWEAGSRWAVIIAGLGVFGYGFQRLSATFGT
jgi:hypothetical protein